MHPHLARARSSLSLCVLLAACGGGSGGGSGDETAGAGTSTGAATTMSSAPTTTVTTGSGGEPTTGDATTGDATSGGAASSSGSASTSGSSGDSDGSSGSTGAVDPSTGADSTTDAESSTSGGTSEGGEPIGELRVLQMNLCHSGVAGCFTGDAVMKKAVAVIKSVKPALVTLNEMCRKDLPALAQQTGAVDHRFTPALKADDSPVKCKNGDDYGIGLLSWVAPTWDAPKKGVYTKQSSQTERRVWICMGYEYFVGCTTHLSTAGATALAQCKELVNGPVKTAAADGPTVMAGDWNMKYKGSPNAQDCVPAGFFRKGDGALQHLLASDDFGFLETIVIDMDGTTDHPGLEVRLTLP